MKTINWYYKVYDFDYSTHGTKHQASINTFCDQDKKARPKYNQDQKELMKTALK